MDDVQGFLNKYSASKNFSLLTWQEKTELCESNHKSWLVANNGGYQLKKNFYCSHYKTGPNGERPCVICKPMKEKARRLEIEKKVSLVFNGNQFMYLVATKSEDETKRLLHRVKKRKSKYLSSPTDEAGGRLFLMDMFDPLSNPEPVDLSLATTMFLRTAANTEYGNIAGSYLTDENDDDVLVYVMPNKLYSVPEVDPELMSNVETEAILTIGFNEITMDNAADLIQKKLALKIQILTECGFKDVKHVGEKEVKVRLAQLRDTWFTAKVSVISNFSLDRFPQGIALKIKEAEEEGLRQLKKENREYLMKKHNSVE